MSPCIPSLLPVSTLLFAGNPLFAEQSSPAQLNWITVLLIFGTGLVAALCWGIGWIISCFRASGSDDRNLREGMAALEARVAALEQAVGSAVAVSSASPVAN